MMTWVGNFIAGIFGRPGTARDDHVRSTIRFIELDRERIRKRLDLDSEGRRRGERNQPAANSEGLDDVEQRIVAAIDSEKKLCHGKLIDYLKTYGDRIGSLGLEGLISGAAAVGDAASAKFRTRVDDGADVLFASLPAAVISSITVSEPMKGASNIIPSTLSG